MCELLENWETLADFSEFEVISSLFDRVFEVFVFFVELVQTSILVGKHFNIY